MRVDFSDITERSGHPATPGQVADMFHRYRWASELCRERHVLEVACGTGQGLGLLARTARTVIGCDIDPGNVDVARATYGNRISVEVADAEHLPVSDCQVDVVLICEALYYLPDVDAFLRECRRVLSLDGALLLTTTNRDVFDFVPSPLSHRYYSGPEMAPLLARHSFGCELFGYGAANALPLRHRMLRPVKAAARRLGLVPQTMRAKTRVRRMIFGRLPEMPRDLGLLELPYRPPESIDIDKTERSYRSLYVVARRGVDAVNI